MESIIKILTPSLTQLNILNILKLGPHSRKDLVNVLCIPRTTIYDHLLKLMNKGLIENFNKTNGKKGRPIRFWQLKRFQKNQFEVLNIKVLCKHCGKETDYSPKGEKVLEEYRLKCGHCKKIFFIYRNHV